MRCFMKKDNIYFKSSDNKTDTHSIIWLPDKYGNENYKIKGVIQIIHGMTEYIERYNDFALYFTNLDYIVCGSDLIGHGESIYHCDKLNYSNNINIDDYNFWLQDIENLREYIFSNYKDVNIDNYTILGFSLGSFLARAYNINYTNKCNNFIIVGTGNPKISELKFAQLILKFVCNKNKPSKLVKNMAFDMYNNKIKNDSKNKLEDAEWLIKDKNERKKYNCDVKIRRQMSSKFFNEFIKCMIFVEENEQNINLYLDNSINIIFISGSDDPVGDIKNKRLNISIDNYEKLVNNKENNVITNVIKGYRHDVIHDSCKNEIYNYIQKFLNEHN